MRARALVYRVVRPAVMLLFGATGFNAQSALAQAGVPVPQDSPLYKAFTQLKSQPGYRMTINIQSNDPRMAQMAAMGMGFSPTEKVVKGDTTQVTMHMKFPATDVRGEIDDWEIRAVVKNGRAAKLITSPAVARYLKLGDQMLQMQLAMMEKTATTAIAQAAAEGPIGALHAATAAAQLAQGLAAAASARKKARDFFSWQCLDQPVSQDAAKKGLDQLTDVRLVGDQTVEGRPAAGYEFYVRDGGRFQGPIRLLIAKDTGLPFRIEMTDPQGHGTMHMDYDFSNLGEIEIPDCLAAAK